MREYLDDMDFLIKLDKANLRTHYAKLTLLSFDSERPIKEIQGSITSGSLNVNGSSAIRRTISLSMFATIKNNDLENIDNEISINKKVTVEIGLKNPFPNSPYEDIIWFPCGMFIISQASVARSTTGWNISINGKDKMALLDGTAGGTLPASITFHESLIQLDDGSYQIEHPTIFHIIYEAVNHWGGESVDNIVISDLDETTKMLVRYMGDQPIFFNDRYSSFDYKQSDDYPNKISYAQDAGYKEVPFTYPGELVLKPGDTVVTLLDKICDLLGNYEYFYDVDGRFIFQQIKNYLNTGSPLTELKLTDYVKSYNNAKYLYSITDLDTTTAITRAPKYDQIKNDFYVWGKRTTEAGVEVDIRYHLAIDTKPRPDPETGKFLSEYYMWEVKDKSGLLIRYDYTESGELNADQIAEQALNRVFTLIAPAIPRAAYEWREELYRRALDAQCTNSVYDNYYDSELIAEWRNIYNPSNPLWNNGWNPAVFNNPGSLNFWLDIIDVAADFDVDGEYVSDLGKYSIAQIGRRTKVVNNKELKSVYNMEVPDVVFMDDVMDKELLEKYRVYGQAVCPLNAQTRDLFTISHTGSSCFDQIRELMYQNLAYNTTVTVTCLPKYYIEVNNVIHIEDVESNINGNFQITQFSIPLTYNGTMNITATEVLTRV